MSNSIFDWIGLFAQNAWLYGGTFLLVLGILVFVHEWGHYIVARLCGVKVDSFSVGFGPEIFGKTDKNGTRWKFSLIPLGGYVKMFGDVNPASAGNIEGVEEEGSEELRPLTEEEKQVAFYTQSVWKRAAIVFAGPAINFLFAIILLFGLYSFYGKPMVPPVATAVVSESAAADAGFLPHDKVLEINGKSIRSFNDIRMAVSIGLDKETDFKLLRDGQEITIKAAPKLVEAEDHFGFKHSKGMLGILSPGSAVQIDKIVGIDGQSIEFENEVRSLLLSKIGSPFTISLERSEDQTDRILVNPYKEHNQALFDPELGVEDEGYNHLVINAENDELFVTFSPRESLGEAVTETANISVSTLEALWQIISGTRSATELGGIIRIGAIAGDMAQSGLIALIGFTALLSINLGLVNLFPIPMLDGGHLVFYAIEAVKGSPISERVQEYAFRTGFIILIGVMLFTNLNDIVQLVQ